MVEIWMLQVLPGRTQKEMRSLSQETRGSERLAVWWHNVPITESLVWKAELVKNELAALEEETDEQRVEDAAWLLPAAYCKIMNERNGEKRCLRGIGTCQFWTFSSPPQCRWCWNRDLLSGKHALEKAQGMTTQSFPDVFQKSKDPNIQSPQMFLWRDYEHDSLVP